METKKRNHAVAAGRSGPSLRSLEFSPERNPLLDPKTVQIKRRYVKTSAAQEMHNPATGEIVGVNTIYTVEDRDDQEFVKVFAEGVKAAFGLSKTAFRVFSVVLENYQNTPMRGGFVDAVYLAWFDGGLSGQDVGMSDRTFQTGLRELLAKGFLAPKSPNLFWVNPALFFKGDRVAFVREFVRKAAPNAIEHKQAEL